MTWPCRPGSWWPRAALPAVLSALAAYMPQAEGIIRGPLRPRTVPALGKKTVKAVHIADLEPILEKYGKGDAFRSGSMKCAVCSDAVTPDNVGSIKFSYGCPSLVCSKLSCYDEIVKVLMQ